MAPTGPRVYKAPVRRLDRVLISVLAGTLAFASFQLPIAAAAGPAGSEQAKIKEAEALYKQGKTKFETADYEQALALWKQAYSLLPDSEDAHVVRNALVYNISEAQIKAYEINRNVTHLRKAKLLLEDYLNTHRQLYGDDAEATKERSGARDRLRQVEKMLTEAEAKGEKATPIGPTEPADAEGADEQPEEKKPEKKPEKKLSPEEQAQRDRIALLKSDPILKAKYQKASSQLVGGSVMAGIGIILVGVGGLSALAIPTCNINGLAPGCERNLLIVALATGIPGLGLAAGGGAMLGIGLKKRRALKDPNKPLPGHPARPAPASPGAGEATPEVESASPEAAPTAPSAEPAAAEPAQPSAWLGPMFLPDGAGATFTVRF